jgi:hypothetical protein
MAASLFIKLKILNHLKNEAAARKIMTLADQFQGVGSESDCDGDDPQNPQQSIAPPPPPLQAPSDFEDYYSEELVVLYHQLKDQCSDNGWRLFENLDFCDFCKFAYVHSSRTTYPWIS